MKPKPPKVLDAIADVVLRYRPKPKSEPAKERRKKRRRIEKEEDAPMAPTVGDLQRLTKRRKPEKEK